MCDGIDGEPRCCGLPPVLEEPLIAVAIPLNERVADPHLAFVHPDAEAPALEFDRKGADGVVLEDRCRVVSEPSGDNMVGAPRPHASP